MILGVGYLKNGMKMALILTPIKLLIYSKSSILNIIIKNFMVASIFKIMESPLVVYNENFIFLKT